jgi:hypothetical protein
MTATVVGAIVELEVEVEDTAKNNANLTIQPILYHSVLPTWVRMFLGRHLAVSSVWRAQYAKLDSLEAGRRARFA